MEQKVVKRTLINANINKNNKLQLLTFGCLMAISDVFMEQQLLHGLLDPLQLTAHYHSY